MKKQILTLCMISAFATSTVSHAIPVKPIFDIAAMLATTYSLLNNSRIRVKDILCSNMVIYKSPKAKFSFFAAHLAVYAYAGNSLWKAYKEYKNNDGTIKVKK